MRYRAFRTKKDNQFYFQFMTDGGDAVLKSQAYSSKADCFTGIRSVIDNAGNADHYEAVPGDDGAFAFKLKAGNNVEIARSVGYVTEDEVNNMIALCQKEIPISNSGVTTETPKAAVTKSSMTSSSSGSSSGGSGSKRGDDYRPLAFYQENISGVENGFDTCTDSDEWYFTYNMNGQVILISEGYNAEAGRDNGIESVKKNMGNADRYKKGVHTNGKHFFGLRAGNHQEIATSRWCADEAEADLTIQALTTGNASLLAPAKAKSMAANTGHKMDEYLGCDAYAGPEGFTSFEKDGEFYFGYNDANGQTLLRSQGYKSEAARNNGIASVKKNGPIHERWKMGDDNGQWYYALKAGNHQEIARSCNYATEKEMKSAYVDATYSFEEKPAVVASANASHENDEYLGCNAYAGAIGFHIFDKEGEFYFAYNDGNGKTLLRSQGYKSEAARDNGINSVKKNGPIEKRWTMGDNDDQWYYALKAGNHQEIARSCDYATEKEMKSAFVSVRYAFEDKPEPVVVKSTATPIITKVTETKTAATAPTPASSKIPDDYMPCEAYVGAAGFHTFFDENRKEYFFAYNDKDGNTLLRSEAYTTAAARNNGISSVKKNAPIEGRWKKETALNGKYHYYTLKAGNNQEIARSCYYEDNEKMNTNYILLGGAFATVGGAGLASSMTSSSSSSSSSKVVKATPPPVKREKEDDYLSCKEYEGKKINDKQNNVALFKHDNGQFYFVLYRQGGSVRLRSEGFETAEGRDQELSGVLKYSDNKEMYNRIERGDYYIDVLKDKTGREVGRSCLQKVAPAAPPNQRKKKMIT
ncbi:MAG: hypothetical protein ACI9VN_001114 [Patescibacteria group bacterium]|jgi:uncharacterized protein YegP (UPF0339 family)